MPLGEYPFSKWYGWVQDRYGLSWQLILVEHEEVQKITPSLLFSNEACGKAEEAIHYYTEIFEDSKIAMISRYTKGEALLAKAKIKYASFRLAGMDFVAMDNGFDVEYGFNEAFSLMVNCQNQQEIDFFFEKLSYVPDAEQCGWLKDKFGLSWQIVPSNMEELMDTSNTEKFAKTMDALLNMKKLNIEDLRKAYNSI